MKPTKNPKTTIVKPSGLVRRVTPIPRASDRARPKTGAQEQYDGKDSTDYADNVSADDK